MKNDGKSKGLVLADQEHGVYDRRLEYGRALAAMQPGLRADDGNTQTLAAAREEARAENSSAAAEKRPAIAPTKANDDTLSKLQSQIAIKIKRKRGATAALKEKQPVAKKGTSSAKKAKCEPVAKGPPTASALHGLMAYGGDDSSSDSSSEGEGARSSRVATGGAEQGAQRHPGARSPLCM